MWQWLKREPSFTKFDVMETFKDEDDVRLFLAPSAAKSALPCAV
jgi:hypothetical protein